MQKAIAFLLLILLSPVFFLLYFPVVLTSKGGFIFRQRRWGKNRRPFDIYKIRTMVAGAQKQKSKLKKLNEADGPVFKISKDPRYTEIGYFLAHTGLDELPQLWNIAKGEMAFVGPRPLPVDEAKKISKKYEKRFSVLPGISSLWVIEGTDHSNFDHWMELDLEYVKKKGFWYDLKIVIKTMLLLIRLMFKVIAFKHSII